MTINNFQFFHYCLFKLIVVISFMAPDNAVAQEFSKATLELGEQLTFSSKILGENRSLNIYLPPSYNTANNTATYPVIYVLDGSLNEDFIHIVGLTQFASFSWINTIPETIVVGIKNVDRKRDFTFPSSVELDKKEFPTAGGSEKFISFLKDEVFKLINKTYRTSDDTTLIGQSLGGLVASEILYKHTSLFKRYIIVSPSLWWDNESLLSFDPKISNPFPKVYIAVGKEGPTMETTAIKLYYKTWLLLNKNDVYYDFLEDANHGDALHIAVYKALKKFKKEE